MGDPAGLPRRLPDRPQESEAPVMKATVPCNNSKNCHPLHGMAVLF
ncbi:MULTISPECIES: hypothetical protein [unclassified Sutcliffiella]